MIHGRYAVLITISYTTEEVDCSSTCQPLAASDTQSFNTLCSATPAMDLTLDIATSPRQDIISCICGLLTNMPFESDGDYDVKQCD